MNNQVETETEAAPVAGGNIRMPTYCDPPNPCPPGYAEADGCLENFENTSEFSRRFQARLLRKLLIHFWFLKIFDSF